MSIWDRFQSIRSSAYSAAWNCERTLLYFSQDSRYDEEYKLGERPDLAALEQAARHLDQASALLERFSRSLRCCCGVTVPKPPKLGGRQTGEMRVRYAEAWAGIRRKYPEVEPWPCDHEEPAQ